MPKGKSRDVHQFFLSSEELLAKRPHTLGLGGDELTCRDHSTHQASIFTELCDVKCRSRTGCGQVVDELLELGEAVLLFDGDASAEYDRSVCDDGGDVAQAHRHVTQHAAPLIVRQLLGPAAGELLRNVGATGHCLQVAVSGTTAQKTTVLVDDRHVSELGSTNHRRTVDDEDDRPADTGTPDDVDHGLSELRVLAQCCRLGVVHDDSGHVQLAFEVRLEVLVNPVGEVTGADDDAILDHTGNTGTHAHECYVIANEVLDGGDDQFESSAVVMADRGDHTPTDLAACDEIP